jgi:hypothetical protein
MQENLISARIALNLLANSYFLSLSAGKLPLPYSVITRDRAYFSLSRFLLACARFRALVYPESQTWKRTHKGSVHPNFGDVGNSASSLTKPGPGTSEETGAWNTPFLAWWPVLVKVGLCLDRINGRPRKAILRRSAEGS